MIIFPTFKPRPDNTLVRHLQTALGAILLIGLAGASRDATANEPLPEEYALAQEILGEMVAYRSAEGHGQTAPLVDDVRNRLIGAGFPIRDIQVISYDGGAHTSIVTRLRGRASGKPAILTMAHIDVVDALAEDWTLEPFTLIAEDGYFYGRGTADNKGGAAAILTTFIRLQREGFVPNRDLIMVFTADEETSADSINYILTQHRPLIEAEYALNSDGGGGELDQGKGRAYNVQASEKVYLTFTIEVRDAGGHSSRPGPDNAIYALAGGLQKLAVYAFPATLNQVTQGYFREAAKLEQGQLRADLEVLGNGLMDDDVIARLSASPYYNALVRTTCVATRLFGGHADNALPQLARATVNCRMLPGHAPDEVEAQLSRTLDDERIIVARVDQPVPSPPSPIRADVFGAVRRLVHARYPGIPIVPNMSTGASDGLYVRNAGIPVYGVSGMFGEANDSRAHGQNERILIGEFNASVDYWYALLKDLSAR